MFQGKIVGSAVPALVLSSENGRFSGQMTFESDKFIKTINFWNGHVTSAHSNLFDDRLGEILYREGKISLEKFSDTLGKTKSGMRFGEVLVSAGGFTLTDLWVALQHQSKTIIQSLCLYEELTIKTTKSLTPPKFEFALQFDVENIFNDVLSEARQIHNFKIAAHESPLLEVEDDELNFQVTDFEKDLVSLVENSRDFINLVENDSRLSPVYTVRELYKIYAKGILKPTLPLEKFYFAEGTRKTLNQTIETANFMFMELVKAADKAQISEWHRLVSDGALFLKQQLGCGSFLHSQQGFKPVNIISSIIANPDFKKHTYTSFQKQWPDCLINQLGQALYSTILFLYFSMHNIKADSSEITEAKRTIDEMRGSLLSSEP